MENITRKVVILDSLKSRNIEKAIFILKDTPYKEGDVVFEAEKIVSDYLKSFEKEDCEKKKKTYTWLWAIVFFTALCTLLIFIKNCF